MVNKNYDIILQDDLDNRPLSKLLGLAAKLTEELLALTNQIRNKECEIKLVREAIKRNESW
jgi:hypothetical protein